MSAARGSNIRAAGASKVTMRLTLAMTLTATLVATVGAARAG